MTVWRAIGLGLSGLLVVLALWDAREVPTPTPVVAPTTSARSAAAGGSTAPASVEAAALGVLAGWDRRRAAAWSAGDAEALRRLYVGGSAAGRADVRLLGEYAAAGVRVRRLTTQLFAVDVLDRGPGRWRLRVVDRVAGGELVQAGRTRPLRSGPVVTRRVELVRRDDGWRVG